MLFITLLLALFGLFRNPDLGPSHPAPPPHASGPVGKGGIIGAEDRKLLAEFTLPGVADPAALRAGLAATQRLTCGASASLIDRPDVIVFSSHQLLLKDGKPDPDVAHCFFVVARKVGGVVKEERYPLLLATLDHGVLHQTKATNDDAGAADDGRDWSIARLARPVPGIVPYRLPDDDAPPPPGTAIVTVSETTENWTGSSKPGDRLAQSCHVIAALPGISARFPTVMHLDCDVGPGASGGAVVVGAASGAPRYLGTIIAYAGDECSEAGAETCFTIARRLDRDLAARIRGTSLLGTGPQAEADRAAQRARLAATRDAVAAAAKSELDRPFPAQDDAIGHEVAAVEARIAALSGQNHAADADALFLDAYRTLKDPDQRRPEWSWLWLQNGTLFLSQGRRPDAFLCFKAAFAVADEALKPYVLLRIGLTTADKNERETDLREAYLAGGAALFRLAGAETDLARIEASGLPTTAEPGDTGD